MSFQMPVISWRNYCSVESYREFKNQFTNDEKFKYYKTKEFIKSDFFRTCCEMSKHLSRVTYVKKNPLDGKVVNQYDDILKVFLTRLETIKKTGRISMADLYDLTLQKSMINGWVYKRTDISRVVKEKLSNALIDCETYFLQMNYNKLLHSIDDSVVMSEMGERRIFKEFLKTCPELYTSRYCVLMDDDNPLDKKMLNINTISHDRFSRSTNGSFHAANVYPSQTQQAYLSPYAPPYIPLQYPNQGHLPVRYPPHMNNPFLQPQFIPVQNYGTAAVKPRQVDRILTLNIPRKLIFISEGSYYSFNGKEKNILVSKQVKNIYVGKCKMQGAEASEVLFLTSLPMERRASVSNIDSSQALSVLQGEFSHLQRLKHTNTVIKTHDFFQIEIESTSFGFLVEDFAKKGDLRCFFETYPDAAKESALRLIDSTIDAVYGVYQEGYLHGDLKPENFVMVENPQSEHLEVRLIDCEGMKKRKATRNEKIGIRCTPIYVDPQYAAAYTATKAILRGSALHPDMITKRLANGCYDLFNEKSEVWSLGIILYWIYRQEEMTKLFVVKNLSSDIGDLDVEDRYDEVIKIISKITEADINALFISDDDPIDNLIRSMLVTNQETRPSIPQVKQQWEQIKTEMSL